MKVGHACWGAVVDADTGIDACQGWSRYVLVNPASSALARALRAPQNFFMPSP
jgi:hypothetical protein